MPAKPNGLETAHVVHDTPGRTRLRIPSRRDDTVYFEGLVKALASMSGIVRVEARPATGSVLVHHTLTVGQLKTLAEQAPAFQINPSSDDQSASASPVIGQVVIAFLKRLAQEDVRAPAAAAFLAIAAFQTARGEFFGPAISHLKDAVELMRRRT